ncbi:MAG: WG repeat-containing protein [Oscillospiraceae bacterium]|nr:WG repeat-containing protein [Oscillospiraceae bacterium]
MKRRIISLLITLSIVSCILSTAASGEAVKYVQVVPFKYDYAYDFYEGLAAVEIEGRLGIIDESGREIVSCQYGGFRFYWYTRVGFSDGLMRVSKVETVVEDDGVYESGTWGYIDRSGKVVIPFEYNYAYDFSDGLAVVNPSHLSSNSFGVIDKNGNVVIPFIYYRIWDNDGVFIVQRDENQYAVIDRTGEFVIPFGKYSRIYWYVNEISMARSAETDKICYIDKSGNEIIPRDSELTGFGDFREGLAMVEIGDWKEDSKSGFIDESGQVAIPLKYNEAADFSEGLAAVMVGSAYMTHEDFIESGYKWGFIDKTGAEVIPPLYDWVESGMDSRRGGFSNGVAVVWRNGDFYVSEYGCRYEYGEVGVIDKSGEIVVPFGEYRHILPYQDGMAIAFTGDWEDRDNRDYCLLDTSGNRVTELGKFRYNVTGEGGGTDLPDYSSGLIAVKDDSVEDGKWGYIKLLSGNESGMETNPKTGVAFPVFAAVLSGLIVMVGCGHRTHRGYRNAVCRSVRRGRRTLRG